MRKTHTWDVFCRVVDHFGDAGVCWRLARQLAAEQRAAVRLWIDDLPSLRRLVPEIDVVDDQVVQDVRVRHWGGPLTDVVPAEIAIEAFGCGLPEEYVAAMAHALPPPVWVVLEYLSAEPWVVEHHGRPSPHPRYPLERYFFFPGFVHGTGGLLREADLFARRDRFDSARRARFWDSVELEAPPPDVTTVSVYAYDRAPVGELLTCWEEGDRPLVAAIPQGSLLHEIQKYFGQQMRPANRILRSGAVEVRVLPFLPQARYDELLWACDCNFVRGEESFVRAQWAARPFVWHVYPQAESTHCAKLEAFLALYGDGLPGDARAAALHLMRGWNQCEQSGVTIAAAWRAFAAHLDRLRDHGHAWADRIADVGELSATLARFCLAKLK